MNRKGTGLLMSLLLLVTVMIVAFVAYRFVSSRYTPATSGAAGATEAASDGAVADGDAADGDASDEVALLADYDATVYTDQGEAVTLSSLADGKPLVINFWATWCPYCVDELPDFQKIVADYEGRVNFAFLDVADGQRERAEDAQAWLKENGFEDLPDYYDSDMAACGAFGVYSYPTTILVSAEGEIRSVLPGRIDPDYVCGLLNQQV